MSPFPTPFSNLAGTQLIGTTTNVYDGNRLVSKIQRDGSGTILASYASTYDAAARREWTGIPNVVAVSVPAVRRAEPRKDAAARPTKPSPNRKRKRNMRTGHAGSMASLLLLS
ncbi:MAG: hypothetical protein K2R98_05750 [Gemmataceae bacterium]|nr:hypothetical protein [Gemmataceae bacterium]